MQSIEVKHEFI